MKNRSLGPVVIWWHMPTAVNIVFEEVFTLTRLWHIIIADNDRCKWLVTYLYCLENGNWHVNFHEHITLGNKQPIPVLLTFYANQSENCLHLSLITYIKTRVLITYRSINFESLYELYTFFFLSRQFSTAIISFKIMSWWVYTMCWSV